MGWPPLLHRSTACGDARHPPPPPPSAYQEFVALFEAKLEAFLAAEGTSAAEFYRVAREVTTKGDEWGDDAVFINLLLASSDYGCGAM